MSRRLPGSLLLIMLALGLFFTRPAWAGSNGEQIGNVLVRISPLTLLLENDVTIKVGDFTCHLVNGVDPSSQCTNLPPGEYEVRAYAEGYFVDPPSYQLIVPGDDSEDEEQNDEDQDNEDQDNEDQDDEDQDEDQDDERAVAAGMPAAVDENEYYFKLYQIRNELYMPNVQVKR